MRTKLPPATGTVQWVGFARNGNRLLEIVTNDPRRRDEQLIQVYEVAKSERGGFDLFRVDDKGEILCYNVKSLGRGRWECDCPDATNRPERKHNCKHCRALSVALRQLPF